jgi:N-acetyl-anhydromuramyl-L-alanine amidase AmpD
MIFLKTSKKTEGTNSKEFIILHHTGGGTFKSNCRLLSGDSTQKKDEVSVHYILGENGEIAKIGEHEDILWHVGEGIISGEKQNLNRRCIGIEVVSDGKKFTEAQREALPPLVREIMEKEGITADRVLRHADVSGYRGKWDLGMMFFGTLTFGEWKKKFLLENNMNEEEKKGLEAGIAFNSSLWHTMKRFPEIQAKLAEMNAFWRENN